MIVLANLSVAGLILLESALSLLELGTQLPTPLLGVDVVSRPTYILTYPHLAFCPSVFLTITVLAFPIVGDGVKDALDPRGEP
jgi:ABC-type dipeptide/oligopeptide/nickel transport system permease subunit